MTPAPRLGFIGRRLLSALAVLFGVSGLTFFIVNILPGNAAQLLAGMEATPGQVAQLEKQLHLDQPAWQRFGSWLFAALRGDLGDSLASGQPVTALLGQRASITFELVAYALLLALGLAVPFALLAVRKPNGILDRLGNAISVAGLSLANYALALLLVLVLAVQWHVFPALGFSALDEGLGHHLRSLALPTIALAFPLLALYARFLRNDLMEQIQGQDYIVAATAKGIGPWRVLIHHALRNSLFGLLTLLGVNLGALLGGTVIIEQMFALPGIGQLLLQAITVRDTVVIQGVVLVLAVTTLLANLVVDLLYAVLDPRIRYE